MLEFFGRSYSEREALAMVPRSDALYGMTCLKYTEGLSEGLEVVEVRNGGGLRFQVLPGRGMDIGALEVRGVTISYLSATGPVASHYFEAASDQFMRGFWGGMMTTCGLT